MYNIYELTGLCLKHDVDFEIWNAETTTGSVRAAMVINLTPAVRVDFGDKEHGQVPSHIHVADNHRLEVKIDNLVNYITQNKVDADWKNGTKTISSIFKSVGGGRVAVTGFVVDQQFETVNGEVIEWLDLEVCSSVRNLLTGAIIKSSPVVIRCRSVINEMLKKLHREDIPMGLEVYAEGYYKYPNVLEVTTAGPAKM